MTDADLADESAEHDGVVASAVEVAPLDVVEALLAGDPASVFSQRELAYAGARRPRAASRRASAPSVPLPARSAAR